MLVIRVKVTCQPGKTEDALAVVKDVTAPSREIDGVISFDIGRDIADPDSIIATEVFEDQAARDRQESLPAVARVTSLLPQITAPPREARISHFSSADPAM